MKYIGVIILLIFGIAGFTQSTEAVDAARQGDDKQTIKAIKDGADVNATDEEGMTALAYDGLNDDYKLVKKLLKLNATVDASAIIASATMDNQKVVKQFTKAGFDVNAKNSSGDTPVFHALKTDNMQLFSFFEDAGANLSIPDSEGNTMLIYAISNNKEFDLIQKLSQNEYMVNQANELGQTPFLLALTNEDQRIVELLMNRGADVNVQTQSGLTPLWFSLEKNDMALFNQFAGKGANVNSIRNGETPLTYAIKKDQSALITSLLGFGADPTVDNASGQTPLSMTLRNNKTELFGQLLLQGKQNLNKPNRYGYTLLDEAFKYSNSTLIKSLIDQGATFGPAQQQKKLTPLMYAIEYGKNDLIYELIEPATINQESFFGKTALILAIEQGNTSLMQELVQRGANVNQKNYMGNAPIGYAVISEDPNLVRQLISSGANVNTFNQYGSTPLIEAAYFNLPQIASLLINAGADRNHRANYGDNAFDIAQKYDNAAVLQVLLR